MLNLQFSFKSPALSSLRVLLQEYDIQTLLESFLRALSILLLAGALLAVFFSYGSFIVSTAAAGVLLLLGLIGKQLDFIGIVLFYLALVNENQAHRQRAWRWYKAASSFFKEPACTYSRMLRVAEAPAEYAMIVVRGIKMVNLAVVGCGYWGPNLIRNFKSASDCCVVLVCDKDHERLKHIQKINPDIRTTTDFQQVLEFQSIDAVVIATTVNSHYPLARKSLEAGKHTFIEKPMAMSESECRELIALAERSNLTLMVGHTFIYNPAVRTIKELLSSGEIGEVMYINSRRMNLGLIQNDINVAWDLAPHDISIILYLLDERPISVNCQGKSHIKPGVEDVISIELNFENESFATIQGSWIDPKKIREMTIVGSKKMITYDDIEPLEKVKIYDKCIEVPMHSDTFAEWQYSYHYGGMQAPFIKQVESLKVECQHFIDCIRTARKPETDGYAGLQVVEILEAATKSLKANGASVSL